MPAKQLSVLVGQLVGETPSVPYLPQEFSQRIEFLLRRFRSLDRQQTFYMHYTLRMAETTYQRLHAPAPGPNSDLLKEFLGRLKPYPDADQGFCQCSVDPASSLRRAESVHHHLRGHGRVLLLGDDDATGLALSLLGDYRIEVIDIDERIVGWLAEMGVAGSVQDLRTLPNSYSASFDAVITDPTRDGQLAGEFLDAAIGSLASGGLLFWADHPDWNSAALSLLERAQSQGLRLLEQRSNLHSYVPHVISDETAHHFRIPPGWFYELVKYARLWSHLYVLSKE